MKAIYVAHPLRGDMPANIAETTKICQQILETEKDILLLSPLHNFSYLNAEKYDAKHGMQMCFELLDMADELWVFGDYHNSEGCQSEIAFAECRGIKIEYAPKEGDK